AGISLTNVLDNPFRFDEIYSSVLWVDLFSKLPKNLGQYKFIRGHFGYWITKFLPKKPIIITMLRKPIDCTLSLYAHQQRSFKNGEYSVLETEGETLDEIFVDPKKRKIFMNHQTKTLNLDVDMLSIIRTLKEEGENGRTIRDIYMPRPPIQEDQELIKTAKQRLTSFEFFGLVEKFEESLLLLYYTFGWFPIASIPKLNVSSNRKKIDEIPKKTLDEIIDATRLDEELYNFGEQIFEKRYHQMIDNLKSRYYESRHEKMKFLDMMYDMLETHFFERNKDYDIDPKNNINYDFGQKMMGSGWQQRELFGNSGTIFRWMGPETKSEIFFPLTSNVDLKITASVILQMSKEILDSLRLEVNGYPITLKATSLDSVKDRKVEFEGIIPISCLKTQKKLSRITFRIDKTISPRDMDKNNLDERKIGLAFDRISIEST
ncbi:MAG: hypothetical protein ACREAK_03015, partial [Nitrosarchaeum sp.]